MSARNVLMMVVGTLAAIALGPACVYLSHAHAATMQLADPMSGAMSAADSGWQMFEQQGPIWGGMALATAFGVTFLKRNESKHWIAQGRTLAIIVAVVGTLASVLSAKFSGTAWSGVLVTAVMALFKLIQPIVNPPVPTPVPARPTEQGSVILSLLMALAVLAVAGPVLASCAGTNARAVAGVGAAFDCEESSLATAAAQFVPAFVEAVKAAFSGDGKIVDKARLRAIAKPIIDNAPRCALAAAIAVIAKTAAAKSDAPAAAPLEYDGAALREAFTSVRAELGWPALKLSEGVL